MNPIILPKKIINKDIDHKIDKRNINYINFKINNILD